MASCRFLKLDSNPLSTHPLYSAPSHTRFASAFAEGWPRLRPRRRGVQGPHEPVFGDAEYAHRVLPALLNKPLFWETITYRTHAVMLADPAPARPLHVPRPGGEDHVRATATFEHCTYFHSPQKCRLSWTVCHAKTRMQKTNTNVVDERKSARMLLWNVFNRPGREHGKRWLHRSSPRSW